MSLIQSIILGIIQGLTEFLPVSSSGHLAIFKYIFGLAEAGMFFDILLHAGTLIAVIAVYYADIWRLIVAAVQMIIRIIRNIIVLIKKKTAQEAATDLKYDRIIQNAHDRFVVMLIVSSIPIAIVGFAFGDFIEKISHGLLIPGICLLITGVLLLLSEAVKEGDKTVKTMTYPNAVFIGIAQAFAALPGVSRSGATISAGMIAGLKKEVAVRYSFILSIPAILGAVLKSGIDVAKGADTVTGTVGVYLIGALVAAAVGYGAIRLLLRVIKQRKFRYFAYYCFFAGLVAIVASFIVK